MKRQRLFKDLSSFASGTNNSAGLVGSVNFWSCSLRAHELNFRFLLEDGGQKVCWRHPLSGRNHGDVVVLGNIPCFPPVMPLVDSGITPITSRRLG